MDKRTKVRLIGAGVVILLALLFVGGIIGGPMTYPPAGGESAPVSSAE